MAVLEQVRLMTLWDVAATMEAMEAMAGEARRYSIMLPSDVAEAAREHGGSGGLSAFVLAAVQRQLERIQLQELVEAAEAEHGPITDEEMRDVRETLARARVEQGTANRSAR